MNRPRYTVGSVTGFPINERGRGKLSARAKPRTTWYVMDSAYGYRVVKTFDRRPKYGPLPFSKKLTDQRRRAAQNTEAEAAARSYCDELNNAHEASLLR